MGSLRVGLTETQHSIIIGSLLGDGAMRCKANALRSRSTIVTNSGHMSTGNIDI
jgi:hypothetical protein